MATAANFMSNHITSSCECLIVGAGPVGLTAALELMRHGMHCRIVDRCAAPTDKSKALVVWPRSLELFDPSGVAPELVAAGMWAKGSTIYGNGKQLVHFSVHLEDSAYPQPLMIPQSETERVLNETLQRRGLPVEREVELVNLEEKEGIVATLRHADGREEHVTCQWLLGCDGAHSLVRKQTGIEFVGEFEPNDWILADVHADGPIAGDEISVFWHRDGILVFFPFAPGRFRVIADLGTAPGIDKPADPTLADAQRVVDERGPAGIRLHDPVWLSGFRIHERKVAQYGRGNVFLCGDAAHIHSPAGGQGMNTGMQDVFNLAWKLALVHQGRANRTLLASYTEERSAVGDMVLHNAGFLTRVATLRNPVLQFIRNHAIALVGKISRVQERGIAELTEMSVHYPDSPLNGDDPGDAWEGEVKSGDRLPDAQVSDLRSGKQAWLLHTIGGAEFSLLLLPAAGATSLRSLVDHAREIVAPFGGLVRIHAVLAADEPADSTVAVESLLRDDGDQLRKRLGLAATAIALVRPDGYLAFRGHAGSLEALAKHLRQYLIAAC